ncbi:unnamed protein product [Rhizoctonia solani]|nr:unnamed protein product [Rhizoctonia solani]
MTESVSNDLHSRWGRSLNSYPKLYTNKALADRLKVPVKAKDRAASRTLALSAIQEICTLSDPAIEPTAYSDIVENITLSKLASILELTRFPDEYENLALPMLVAGCIELLSSVTPSPFACEYGYLCFRALIFALNTCLLKYAEIWEGTIALIESTPPNQRLLRFWDRSAQIILEEAFQYDFEKKEAFNVQSNPPRRWSIPCFDQGKLDKLLSVLHSDRKNFLIALRDTGSLGLSALFFITKKHMESKRASMSKAEYVEKVFLPYCRVFYRYQVVLPDLGPERFVSRSLFPADMNGISDSLFIDTEDSRNILRAYISSVQSPGHCGKLIFADGLPLSFIILHALSGCEDLIPDMFEATIRVLWDILLIDSTRVQTLDHYVRCVMYNFCCVLSYLKAKVTHSRTIEHSWIYKLTDKIVENDVVGLILRSTLLKSTTEPDDSEWGRNAPHEWTSSRQFLNLTTFLPPHYVSDRIRKSGALCDWFRYHMHLDPLALDCLQGGPTGPGLTIQGLAARLIPHFCSELVGDQLQDSMLLLDLNKMCENPRCPAPFKAGITHGRVKQDGTYCSSRCIDMDCMDSRLE